MLLQHGQVSTIGETILLQQREVRGAILLLMMIFLHASVYLPLTINWSAWSILQAKGSIYAGILNLMKSIGQLLTMFTIMPKLANFYLYLFRVPHFGKAIIALMRGKCSGF